MYTMSKVVDDSKMDRYKVFDVNNESDSIYAWASDPIEAVMKFFDQVFEYENLEGVVVEKQLLGDICEFVGVFCL